MRILVRSTLLSMALAALSLGCGPKLPAVISSTGDRVAIEYEIDDGVGKAGKLARAECESHGKMADYNEADSRVTPKSGIATFDCVGKDGRNVAAPPPAPAATPTPSTPEY